jgi:sulfonate transport system ATP-binding protein
VAPVRVTGLRRSFGARSVLRRVDFSIAPGEFVALLGPSGSGKSTILRALAGLDREIEGDVVVPAEHALVFQEHRLLPWKRVAANVGLGLPGAEANERVAELLNEVRLADRADAWPLTLSGGEAQRAAIARALVREPQLLLLDEPFSSLDALTRLKVHALVLELWRRHRPAVLLVTHDVDEALVLADRALVLNDGRIALDLPISSPRPRRRTDPALAELRERILGELGVDDPS